MLQSSFRQYLMGTAHAGMGLGIVLILARWITGNPPFASPELIVKYGIFGGLGFAVATSFAMVLFAFLAKRIRAEMPEALTIGDYLQHKLKPWGYRVIFGFLMVVSASGMIAQGTAAGLLLAKMFHLPFIGGAMLFSLVCVLYGGFGGSQLIHKIALVQVFFIFAAVILLPVYFFVREGVAQVYDGIRLYHPYLLVFNNPDSWLFIGVGGLIGFGRVLADRTFWQQMFSLEEKKVMSTILLSAVIWLTFPVALSALIMISIYSGGFEKTFSLLFELIGKVHSPFLLVVYVIGLLCAFTGSFATELHSLVGLLVRNVYQPKYPSASDRDLLKRVYLFAALIGFISFLFSSILSVSLLDLLFFFGVIDVSLFLPMIIIIFSRDKVSTFIPIICAVAIIAGYISIQIVGQPHSIVVSFTLSALLTGIFLGVRKVTDN